MERKRGILFATLLSIIILLGVSGSGFAIDSDLTRRTLSGVEGVNVVVEELQPNIQRFAEKVGLQKEQIRTDVETLLRRAGIVVLNYDQWLVTPGRPFLYIAINTHEHEKYWYAYDIKVELRQNIVLEANTQMRTMAPTWSINMTGITNVGKLDMIKNGLTILLGRFVDAWHVGNPKR